ncbi:hypothetical protein ALO83_100836 [Pseudomonas cannabina pv. alisalensis]|uniref:DUF1161 domain-containing protein n=1 Tax=Pseudomonas cannabina TaxID=86840 RepID=A0A3M3QK56_PSECA|nr:hypothetical protein ALO83_100836 [Pseudomonas cannabina pv. alisalensis]RMN76985.1 hypothetical protein ALQ52_101017 [Pseudomonas cannabina pv. alisalensis]RMN84596.1 hypothetical protein ALQ53_100803 [Pseudomonas cannabina]RMN96899.1 hypothetical protein ALQ51_100437 [Pseudomonas cannabina]
MRSCIYCIKLACFTGHASIGAWFKFDQESSMKRFILAVTCTVLATSALAAPKSCEELKDEIEAKIQANNVTSYTLEIVANEEATDPNMVVGTCDNGTKKIIYQRNDR